MGRASLEEVELLLLHHDRTDARARNRTSRITMRMHVRMATLGIGLCTSIEGWTGVTVGRALRVSIF